MRTRSTLYLLIILVLVRFDFGYSQETRIGQMYVFPEHAVATGDPTALSLDSLKNALVRLPRVGEFRLEDGAASVKPPEEEMEMSVWFSSGFINVDLDGDGLKDAIGGITENFEGGSGFFNSLDIFLNRNGSPFHAASYSIGDRETADSLRVIGNILDVFFTVHGPDDPSCCPKVIQERKLRFLSYSLTVIN